MSVEVVIATTAEWDELIALWQADWKEGQGTPAEEVRQGAIYARETFDFLSSDSFWLVLARRDGHPAGFAHVCRIPRPDARAGLLFVDQLFVHPDDRRQGVGLALLERVARLSEELDLAGVRLLVEPENDAARALYRKAGFKEALRIQCERRSSHWK